MSDTGSFNVLWVYQRMSAGALKVQSGQLPSLCWKGRKHMFCVAAGHPVRVIKRDVQDFDRMRPVLQNGKPYAIEAAIQKFEEIGGRNGITRAAVKLLARAGNERVIVNEEELPDEEEMKMEDVDNLSGATVTSPNTTESKVTKKTSKAKPAAKPKAEKKAKPAAKPKAEKKTKSAAKPKAEKKTKSAAKPKAEKKAGDGLGREGSLTRFMNERLLKGQDNATISEAAKKAFPDSNTTDPSHVSWYRWNATKKGILKG